jgi:hypothetical protein
MQKMVTDLVKNSYPISVLVFHKSITEKGGVNITKTREESNTQIHLEHDVNIPLPASPV